MPLPGLPEEILLHIFTFIEPANLWLSTRLVLKSFNRIIVSHLQFSVLPFFKISISYNLGGSRWYDVRTRVFLSYDSISKEDKALFNKFEVHPEPYHNRALEKWKALSENRSFDPSITEWTVQLRIGNPRLCDMHEVKLSRTTLIEGGAVVDWKELLSAYFHVAAKESVGSSGISELTTPASLHAAAISYVRGTG